MKETRYVLCDCCGNKIYLGSEIFEFDGYCGIYCSAECYADAHATVRILDEDEVENCGCDIFDDNAISQEITNIQEEILKLQNRLDELKSVHSVF